MLLSDPMIQLSTPATKTGATDFKTGTHLYFVKGRLPKAGYTYNMSMNTDMGFSDE